MTVRARPRAVIRSAVTALLAAWVIARMLDDQQSRGVGRDGEYVPSEHEREYDEPYIQIDTSPESIAEATGAAVAHVLDRPDSIRQRAQNAASISSAVVAALVVAAIAGLAREQTESWNDVTKVLVIVAMGMWIMSVVLFVRVLSFTRLKEYPGPTYPEVVRAYQDYATKLRKRLRSAAVISALALASAAVAVGAEVYELTTSHERQRDIALRPAAVATAARLCGQALPEEAQNAQQAWLVRGTVGTSVLSRKIVPIKVLMIVEADGDRTLGCGRAGVEIRFRQSDILASSDAAQD